MTALALTGWLPPPARQAVHGFWMWLFLGRLGAEQRLYPVAAALSGAALLEGTCTVLMRWAAAELHGAWLGAGVQVLLSLTLAGLLWDGLGRLAERLPAAPPVLTAPCLFWLYTVRSELGLDQTDLSAPDYPLAGAAPFWELAALAGAAAALWGLFRLSEEAARSNARARALDQALNREERLLIFQHDVNNHLAVLSGLIERNASRSAQTYAGTLQAECADLRTGSGLPALDVLLAEKTEQARKNGAALHWKGRVPTNAPAAELCAVLGNALDNALQASLRSGVAGPVIFARAVQRQRLLVLEVENPAPENETIQPGTGLRSIRRIAERFGGSLEIKQSEGRVRLSVLLCLPDA